MSSTVIVSDSNSGEFIRLFARWTGMVLLTVFAIAIVMAVISRNAQPHPAPDPAASLQTPVTSDPAIRAMTEKAANGDRDAMFSLALAYEHGSKSSQDYSKSIEWYRKAVNAGSPQACTNLAKMLLDGHGASAADEAIGLLRKGYELGSSKSAYNLGWAYQKGLGVPIDYSQSMMWYGNAAKMGDPEAVNSIGYMYAHGYGVERNDPEALAWYALAASMGSETAAENYNKLSDGATFFGGCGKSVLTRRLDEPGTFDCVALPKPKQRYPVAASDCNGQKPR